MATATLWLDAAWRWRKECRLVPPNPSLFAIGLSLLGVLGIATIGAINRILALQTIVLAACWLTTAWTVAAVVTQRSHLNALLRGMVAACALAAGYGILQAAGVLEGAPDRLGIPASISTMGNQNYLAELLAVALFPSLPAWRARSRRGRWLAAAGTGILMTGLLVCRSAGSILAVSCVVPILAGAVWLTRRGRFNRVKIWLIACSIGCALAGLIGVAFVMQAPDPDAGHRRDSLNPVRKLFVENSGEIRLTDWAIALKAFGDRPLTGVGPNNYKVVWPGLKADLDDLPGGFIPAAHVRRATQAHNEYLQFLAETGLIGAALMILAAWAGWNGMRRRLKAASSVALQEDYLFLGAGVAVAAINACVSFPCHLPATATVLALVAGAASSDLVAKSASRLRSRHCGVRWNPVFSIALAAAAVTLAGLSVREFVADARQRAGQQCFAAGDLRKARRLLDRSVPRRLWPGEGLVYWAMAGSDAGTNIDTEEILERSLRTEPTFEAYLLLAESRRDRDDFRGAIGHLDRLDACRPTMAILLDSRFVRGTVHLRQGEGASARRLLEGVLADDPEYHRALIALGYLEALCGRDDEAAEYYRQAVTLLDRKIEEARAGTFGDTPAAAVGVSRLLEGRRVRLEQHRRVAEQALASVDSVAPGDRRGRHDPGAKR